MKRLPVIVFILALVIVLASCAPGPNDVEKTPNAKGQIAGFWLGLWQGLIAPITFVISIFTKNIRVYEIHNNGTWYNLGFVIGAGLFLHGGVLGTHKARRRC